MLTDKRAEHHGGPTGQEGSHVRGFGELEAAVMERLWRADSPRTVREMHTELTADRPLAYTTVMTVMDKLHRKGWLTREPVGRAYAYTTAISKDRYTADLMGEALATSSNRSAALLAFLDRLTPDEAAQLRAALDEQASNPTPTAEAHSSRRRTR